MSHTIYKGQVNVEVSGESYRIRFTHHGQRKSFGTGIKRVDISSEQAAIAIAKQIESDMYRGTFDETLEKYKPDVRKKPVLSLSEQFDIFLLEKQKEVRPYTYDVRYLAHKEFTKKLLCKFSQLKDFTTKYCVNEMLSLKTVLKWNSLKCKVSPLILFWDWMQSDVDVPINPWRKALQRFKPDEIEKPEPFSTTEREVIINTMSFNESLRPWLPVTRFLMSTGCRPGEAFALTFGDVDQAKGSLTFSKSAVEGIVGKTKTSKSRKIPLTTGIRESLELASEGRDLSNESLCFPHPKNKGILTSGEYLQQWKKALKIAGVPYRKPYANRHTFITEALLQGGNPAEVAQIAGNSPQVIYRHYLNVTGDTGRSMPDI